MLYHMLVERNIDVKRPIICVGNRHYTYQELDKMVRSFSAFLVSERITKGDRIVIVSTAGIDTIVAVLGCIASGVVFIPVDSSMAETEREQIIEETGAKCVLETFVEELDEEEEPQRIQRIWLKENDWIYILYTSGSTSRSKGVIGCVSQIIFCVERINKRLMNGTEDKILCALPLSFDYGLYQIFLSLASGAELFLTDGKNLQKIPAILLKEQITAFPVVPSMLHILVYGGLFERMDFSKLRYICATGDKLNLKVVEAVHNRFPLVEIIPMYGLTECKRVSVMPRGNYEKTRKGSCGIPLEDIEVRLWNQDSEGTGELVVIGDNVMEGYYLDEGKEEVFFIDPITGKKALRTGDLFQIDEDGFLYFRGRIKRMIKTRGFRISNVKIESFFSELETVMEIRVLGIPDDMIGEKIGLAVYGKNSDVRGQISGVCDKLSFLYRPHLIYISTVPLPKNVNGKYDDNEICRQIISYGEKWV